MSKKRLPSQPEDTTNTGPGKGYMTSKEIHPKAKKRQDGVNHKDSVNAGDHLWKHEYSETQGPIEC